MSFNWKVLVFERRLGREIHWYTVGLPSEKPVHVKARHSGRLFERLEKALQDWVGRRSPSALATFRQPRRPRLLTLPLELTLKGDQRRKVSGTFPVVLEAAPVDDEEPCFIAYSPLRPVEWKRLDDVSDPSLEMAAFFGRSWGGLSTDALDELRAQKRDRLHVVSVELNPKTLIRRLKGAADKSPDRVGAGRRREKVLDHLASDESGRLRHLDSDHEARAGRPRRPYRRRLLQRLADPVVPTVLIGPSGCGKSTLIRRAVLDLLVEDGYYVHRELGKCRRVWRIAGRRLIAGMSYVGEWEQRCLDLLDELRVKRRRRQRPILWIEDLHAFGRIGQSRDSDRSLADVFRGPISRGEMAVLGEATPEAWQLLEEDAPTFAALFQPIWVQPTENDEALGLLLHEARGLELDPDVEIRPSAYRVLVETARAVYGEGAHPGRSMEILRALGTDQFWAGDESRPVDASVAVSRVAGETGLPATLLEPREPLHPQKVERRFASGILGQPEAVATVKGLVATLKAGLDDPTRPYGVFLFTGPTGTGKTELTKYLATWLYGDKQRLIRFDMGEHGDPWSTARLVGDRIEPDGLLTEAVRAQPFSVVLLDEIEKAHPSILNLLLQVFDEGRLTDAAGRVADFSNTVIVLTSNLGCDGRSRVGFGSDSEAVLHDVRRAVEAFFSPELRNRIDRIVPFWPLTPEVAEAIAAAELKRLLGRRGLAGRGMFVTVDPSVVKRVAEEGFNADQGARAVKRYLDRHVGGALARELASRSRSELQLVRLFAPRQLATPDDRFAARVYAFEEAPPLDGESALDDLLDASPAQRPKLAVPQLLQQIDGLLEGPDLTRRLEEANRALAEPEDRSAADRLASLDQLRERLAELRERLAKEADRQDPEEGELLEAEKFGKILIRDPDWDATDSYRRDDPRMLERHALTPDQVVEMATEVHLLASALRSPEPDVGRELLVELTRVGDADLQADIGSRLSDSPPDLMAWLADGYIREGSYAQKAGDGLVAFASDRGHGSTLDELRSVLEACPRHLVLHLEGLALGARFAGEVGIHELTTDREFPDLVQIAVRPVEGTAEQGFAKGWWLERRDRRQSFLESLAAGEAAPADPDRPLPLIRRIRFDSGSDGEPFRATGGLVLPKPTECEVEDPRLCRQSRLRVRRLIDGLRPMRLRIQTWRQSLELGGQPDGP